MPGPTVLLREHGGRQLGIRQAGGGGHVGQVAGRLGQRPAVPLHENAAGDRDGHRVLAVRPDPGELAPLALDDRGQPRRAAASRRAASRRAVCHWAACRWTARHWAICHWAGCHRHRLRYG